MLLWELDVTKMLDEYMSLHLERGEGLSRGAHTIVPSALVLARHKSTFANIHLERLLLPLVPNEWSEVFRRLQTLDLLDCLVLRDLFVTRFVFMDLEKAFNTDHE